MFVAAANRYELTLTLQIYYDGERASDKAG
jgi:hypothetical protein